MQHVDLAATAANLLEASVWPGYDSAMDGPLGLLVSFGWALLFAGVVCVLVWLVRSISLIVGGTESDTCRELNGRPRATSDRSCPYTGQPGPVAERPQAEQENRPSSLSNTRQARRVQITIGSTTTLRNEPLIYAQIRPPSHKPSAHPAATASLWHLDPCPFGRQRPCAGGGCGDSGLLVVVVAVLLVVKLFGDSDFWQEGYDAGSWDPASTQTIINEGGVTRSHTARIC